MTTQRFPSNFYIESPFFDEFPDSVVIPQDYQLPVPISEKEATYFDYFQNINQHLEEIAQQVSCSSFIKWLLALKEGKK